MSNLSNGNSLTLKCWQCGEVQSDLPLPISRHANCQKCFEVLHCCRFCIHYNERANDACEEEDAEAPNNKESANFCEYFKPNALAFDGKNNSNDSNTQAKLNALFGEETDTDGLTEISNEVPESPLEIKQDKPSNPLDSLFDDD